MRNKSWLIGLAFLAVAATVVVVWTRRPPDSPPAAHTKSALPPLSQSPYLNTGPEARYVGLAACKECHPARHSSYLHTSHSHALADLDPAAEPPDGAFEHKLSGRSYRVYRAGKEFRHEEILRAPDGTEVSRQDFSIRYLIGSGHFSRSYLVEDHGFLSESPITWYTQKKQWSVSPGYDIAMNPGFTRSVTTDCLFCHAGRVERKEATSDGVRIAEQPIGCESCHGPGSLHIERRRSTKHPPGTDDLTIVNPRKLPRPLLEAVCGCCHLQGVAWADVRGRQITDFRPGMPFHDYRVHYLPDSGGDRMRVVGHFEQLRQSVCYQKSEEMSCLTCHDPHRRDKPADLTEFYRAKCLDCHAARGCTLDPAARKRKEARDDCTVCHMPRGDTDIPHISFTHHRIGRHTSPPPQEDSGVPALVPMDDTPRLGEMDRKRNLGLAYLMMAFKVPDRNRAFAYGRKARGALEAVYEAGLRDGATLQSLARIHRQENELGQARRFAEEALAAKDVPIEARVDALVLLGEGYFLDQEFNQALPLFEELTRLRRVADDWRLLGMCRLGIGQTSQARAALERALAIRPYDYRAHFGLAEVHRLEGNQAQAREHADKARWLEQYAKSHQP